MAAFTDMLAAQLFQGPEQQMLSDFGKAKVEEIKVGVEKTRKELDRLAREEILELEKAVKAATERGAPDAVINGLNRLIERQAA